MSTSPISNHPNYPPRAPKSKLKNRPGSSYIICFGTCFPSLHASQSLTSPRFLGLISPLPCKDPGLESKDAGFTRLISTTSWCAIYRIPYSSCYYRAAEGPLCLVPEVIMSPVISRVQCRPNIGTRRDSCFRYSRCVRPTGRSRQLPLAGTENFNVSVGPNVRARIWPKSRASCLVSRPSCRLGCCVTVQNLLNIEPVGYPIHRSRNDMVLTGMLC